MLELLTGALVGPKTARDVAKAARKHGAGTLAAKADGGVWPEAAADALTALVLDCIASEEEDRPAGMAAVLARIKDIRALVDSAAPPLVRCGICLEDVPEATGARCQKGGHFYCFECLRGVVGALAADLPALAAQSGRVPCPDPGCAAPPWTIGDLSAVLDKGTLVAFTNALIFMHFDGPRAKRDLELKLRKAKEDALREGLALADMLRQLREVAIETAFYLKCPACAEKSAEHDEGECNSLTCRRCGVYFCALCLEVSPSSEAGHNHFQPLCPATNGALFDRFSFEQTRKERVTASLVAFLATIAGKGFFNIIS